MCTALVPGGKSVRKTWRRATEAVKCTGGTPTLPCAPSEPSAKMKRFFFLRGLAYTSLQPTFPKQIDLLACWFPPFGPVLVMAPKVNPVFVGAYPLQSPLIILECQTRTRFACPEGTAALTAFQREALGCSKASGSQQHLIPAFESYIQKVSPIRGSHQTTAWVPLPRVILNGPLERTESLSKYVNIFRVSPKKHGHVDILI